MPLYQITCWSRSSNLRKGVFAPFGLPKPLPLGEVSRRRRDGEGKPGTKEPLRSDGQALCQSDAIAVSELFVSVLALSVSLRSTAPPKGEPLAGRATSYWTPEVRYGAKGRALLQRAAASGQRTLSSCRWPRQRSTTVPGTSRFARPGESCPTRQWLPLWGSCHRR